MSKNVKILIVAVVIVAVAAVLALKENGRRNFESVRLENSQIPDIKKADDTKALPRLVDLGAKKCIPCKMMAPILEQLKREYAGKFEVQFYDVWENPDAAKKHGINIIPTQIFFDASGKELFRHEGFYSKADILGKWKELGVNLEKGTNNEIN